MSIRSRLSRLSRPSRLRVRKLAGALLVALFVALAPACATSGALTRSSAASVDHLLTLIVDRLAVAPDVARTKWNTHAPIEDLPREQQVIAAVGESAAAYGVPRGTAETFFRAQIEASKIIQRTMTDRFSAEHRAPFAPVVSLDTIRPVLDRLTPEMLRALGAVMPLAGTPAFRRAVMRRSRAVAPKGPGGDAAMTAAVAPLVE